MVAQRDGLFQIFQPEAVLVRARYAVKGREAAHGHNQLVKGNVRSVSVQHLVFHIDAAHVTHDEMHIGIFAENGPQRVGYLPRFQFGRGNLIEQRQKSVVVVSVDQNDIQIFVARQSAHGPNARKTAACDDDPRSAVACAARHADFSFCRQVMCPYEILLFRASPYTVAYAVFRVNRIGSGGG
jgi:hypothetical protein